MDTIKIGEYFEKIKAGQTNKAIAESIGKPAKALNRALQRAGYKYDATAKEWQYAGEGAEPLDEVFVFGASGQRVSETVKSQDTNEGTKEISNEQTNVQTNQPTKSRTNKQTKVQAIEQKNIVRKRSSFDIDVELTRQLKVKAAMEDKNVYEMVEQAIRDYLQK